MKEILVSAKILPGAYHNALEALDKYGEYGPCSDYDTAQKELAMTIVVEQPLAEPMISKLFLGDPRSLEQYRQEILYGILDFEIERGNWHYTYHRRMEEQIPWVKEELQRNPDSRRAVIDIRSPEDLESDSPACLQHIHYLVRDNALHCKTLFRSNDACKATFMNMFALILLQKSIADELGVEMGTYTHRANSFHCYERDFGLLGGYLNRIEGAKNADELCYSYEDDWRELMEDSQEEIQQLVDQLKNKR